MRHQRRLDLPWFDPDAMDLDLIIQPAEEGNRTVLLEGRQIARSVDPLVRGVAEGMRHEGSPGQLRAGMVAPSQM